MASGTSRRLRRLAGALLIGAVGFSCSEDDLTMLGSELRTPPADLVDTLITAVRIDSVFPIPVSLGASPRGQIGNQGAYTTHVLYAFFVPTVFEDSLQLSAGRVGIDLNADPNAFDGTMRIGLREVAPSARDWNVDSVLTALPELTQAVIAPPETLSGAELIEGTRLEFVLDLSQLADYDSVVAHGDSLLEVNVAVMFSGFESGGPGFVEYSYLSSGNEETGTFNATYEDEIDIVAPDRRLTVVEFDSTYSAGTNLVTSDGFRLHSFVHFDEVRTVLPESAIVYRSELVLRQADRGDSIFGIGPEIGVIVPSDAVLEDSTLVFSEEENTRDLAFRTLVVATPDNEVVIDVTPYVFDQQEGNVVNRGMLLRLSNEGTSARHLEFYGPRDAVADNRPQLRIIYGLPADFGETQP